VTTEKEMSETEVISDLTRGEKEAEQRLVDRENARIAGQYNAVMAKFIQDRKQVGDLVVEGWESMERQPWPYNGSLVVYERHGYHYWVGRPVKLDGLKYRGEVTVSDDYAVGGFLAVGQGAYPMFKLTDLAVMKYRGIWEDQERDKHEKRERNDKDNERALKLWLGEKKRYYGVVEIFGGGTEFQYASIGLLKDKMAEYGIKAVRSKTSGRVVVSRPQAGGRYLIISEKWFSLAQRFAEYLTDDLGKCDISKCQRSSDKDGYVTKSGAVICGHHANKE